MSMRIGTKVAGAGGVGSAIGVVMVVVWQIVQPDVMTVEQAALLTAAFGTIAGFVMRYLPAPGE